VPVQLSVINESVLIKQIKTEEGNRFWPADNQQIGLWSKVGIAQKQNYIHQNPVEK
jgi:hypothetical protein